MLKSISLLACELGPNAEKIMLHAIFLILITVFNPTWLLTL